MHISLQQLHSKTSYSFKFKVPCYSVSYIQCCIHNNDMFTFSFIIDHVPSVQEESLYNNILDSQFDMVNNNNRITDQSGKASSECMHIGIVNFY